MFQLINIILFLFLLEVPICFEYWQPFWLSLAYLLQLWTFRILVFLLLLILFNIYPFLTSNEINIPYQVQSTLPVDLFHLECKILRVFLSWEIWEDGLCDTFLVLSLHQWFVKPMNGMNISLRSLGFFFSFKEK